MLYEPFSTSSKVYSPSVFVVTFPISSSEFDFTSLTCNPERSFSPWSLLPFLSESIQAIPLISYLVLIS